MAKLSKKKRLLLFVSWVAVVFAGGYYYGRSTSIKWDDEETAYLYMGRSSHWIHTANGRELFLHMPDGIYTFDGQHAHHDLNVEAIVAQKYPVVGGEEYQHWTDSMVEDIAAAGATKIAVDTYGSRVTQALEGLSKREWVILTAASAGSFAVGYVLGHRFTEDFNAPKFHAALDDDKTWKRVWDLKQNLLQIKANLDTASKNLAVINEGEAGSSKENADAKKLAEQIKKQYKLVYDFDPDLRNDFPIQEPKNQSQP
jgi:hypothetical protein